jgi:cytidylate kinase
MKAMSIEKRLCVICAWRENCQKRFSVKADFALNVHCPDFTRDFTIKDLDADNRLVNGQLERWQKEKRPEGGPVIAISRQAGAGGSEIARKLAKDLKMDLIGGQIISRVAESAKMSEKVVRTLDEKHVSTVDSWLTSFFTSRHLWPDVYLRHLSKVILTIGKHGNAVVVGRGAQFILPAEKTFRVRFIAPMEQRAERVMRTHSCSREDAERYILQTDSDRTAFIQKYFHEDVGNPANYDFVLNTANLDVDEAAAAVEGIYKTRRFD